MAQAVANGKKEGGDQNFDYMFKLLIIGNSSVGKTSFLFRYCDNSFTSAFVSTVGIDFKVKTVIRNDKKVKLQIWVRILIALVLCVVDVFRGLFMFIDFYMLSALFALCVMVGMFFV